MRVSQGLLFADNDADHCFLGGTWLVLSRRLAGPAPPICPDASEEALSQVSYDEVDIRKGIPMETTSKGYVVVGGSGFVGSCIVKLLLLRGEDNIRIIDLQEPPQDLRGLPSVTWSRADITNAQEIRDAVIAPFASGKHAQVIYLTAATLRFWERAAYTWDHTYKINVLGVRNVLEAAKDLPNATVVYTSSAGVSVPTAKYLRLEHSEESVISDETPDPPVPQSCYYRSKRLAEDLVRKANKECPTIKAAILRPGYTITGPHDRKLSSVLSLSVLPVWDGNWGSRDIFVWDCAAAHLCCERALEHNPDEVSGETFLISGEDTALWSLHDVRNAVKFYAKREITLKPVSPLLIYIVAHLIEAFLYLRYHVLYLVYRVFFGTAPAILPKWMGEAIYLQPSTLNYFANVRLDDSRARKLLGYRPQWSLAQSIKYTVDQIETEAGVTIHGFQLKGL